MGRLGGDKQPGTNDITTGQGNRVLLRALLRGPTLEGPLLSPTLETPLFLEATLLRGLTLRGSQTTLRGSQTTLGGLLQEKKRVTSVYMYKHNFEIRTLRSSRGRGFVSVSSL